MDINLDEKSKLEAIFNEKECSFQEAVDLFFIKCISEGKFPFRFSPDDLEQVFKRELDRREQAILDGEGETITKEELHKRVQEYEN